MASNIERRWRQIVDGASKAPNGNNTEGGSCQSTRMKLLIINKLLDSKLKKRKLEPAPSKSTVPNKKPALGSASSSKPVAVKKEPGTATMSTTTAAAAKATPAAKSDSSFFSAPKPKPKLPSFKKAPVPVKKESDTNIAQPSSIDPFQEALKSMAKSRRDSPLSSVAGGAASTPPSISTPPQVTASPAKVGKKKKSVTWAPDGSLVSIRMIERAIYDDDPVDVSKFSPLFVKYSKLTEFLVCYSLILSMSRFVGLFVYIIFPFLAFVTGYANVT
jgi:protein phosphatase 1 regulatory subunit 10